MAMIVESAAAWRAACEDVAEEILAECGISGPPVDAFAVADALGLTVAFDAGQQGRGRLKGVAGRTSIFLRPEERPERLQWTVAHEIGEAVAHRIFAHVGHSPEEPDFGRREQVANRMASALLLPRDWFLRDARLLDSDVLELKKQYATASHELVLLNLLRLPDLTLVSVFDHGRLTRRRSNGQLPAPRLLPLETQVQQQLAGGEERMERVGEGVRVQGWAVHEPGWPRELLRTTPVEPFDLYGDN
ncbi:MAG: ImmA/IrrE family metallo-endopeptidase [Maioricimonas sp. JB049]